MAKVYKLNWVDAVRGFSAYTLGMIYLWVAVLPMIPFMFMMSRRSHNRQAHRFADVFLFCLKHICSLDHVAKGLDNFPDEPCIVVSNHQSAWETVYFAGSRRLMVSVFKKSLFYIPVYGLVITAHGHISIDRGKRRQAIAKVIEQGQDRLKKGLDILIFPEGTRLSNEVDKVGRFNNGAFHMSVASGAPIMPVAHNAGVFWPRNTTGKYPGTIQVSYGKPIYPEGRTAKELNEIVSSWIEKELGTLPHKY